MKLKSCVHPSGRFVYGVHKPGYTVKNLRENTYVTDLGELSDGTSVKNKINFPQNEIEEKAADWIYEIPNPFPFRGSTYIARRWAEQKAGDPSAISLPPRPEVSYLKSMERQPADGASPSDLIARLPETLQLALATSSTDPDDLVELAKLCCQFVFDQTGKPTGLTFGKSKDSKTKPLISNFPLFEALANNDSLPNEYKEVMVLRPGIQGGSEIVGEWTDNDGDGHIFEYLRRNSYIPWGHYAANMANDAVRYRIKDLSFDDMRGLRHLYYQRTFVRLSFDLKLADSISAKTVSENGLESLRKKIREHLSQTRLDIPFDRTLWGWNFGFDYAPSHYRLHASHQQVHQQYAMIPTFVSSEQSADLETQAESRLDSFACGDLIDSFCRDFRETTGVSFFNAYLNAIKSNRRMDGRKDANQQLAVYEDDDIIVFVPKAQTSQWELQMMTKRNIGNILETTIQTRKSLDRGIYIAVQALAALGARMITSIEFSKRFQKSNSDQRLLYSFLPKLPESPGAFSEAQLRWINGHYPEDFASACRSQLPKILETFVK